MHLQKTFVIRVSWELFCMAFSALLFQTVKLCFCVVYKAHRCNRIQMIQVIRDTRHKFSDVAKANKKSSQSRCSICILISSNTCSVICSVWCVVHVLPTIEMIDQIKGRRVAFDPLFSQLELIKKYKITIFTPKTQSQNLNGDMYIFRTMRPFVLLPNNVGMQSLISFIGQQKSG